MFRTTALTVTLGLVSATATTARADIVLFSNGGPVMTNGFLMNTFLEADNFALSGPSQINAIHFWDLETPSSFAGSIYYAIYAGGATPGAVLASGTSTTVGRTQVGPSGGGVAFTTLFLDDVTITPAVLPAGNYFLGLHNGPVNTVQSGTFAWAENNGTNNPPSSFNQTPPGTGSFVSNGAGNELAFNLSGVSTAPVPAPPAVVLVGLGAGCVALRRYVGRRATA
jgi:hypothetical protein